MSEPILPVPSPEENSWWDPSPARCPECGAIIDAHPASRHDGRREGWCPRHGTVIAFYGDSRDSENEEDKDETD